MTIVKMEECLMQLELVKNHLREAYKMLHEIAKQDAKKKDLSNPENMLDFCDRYEVNKKARDLIGATMFVLKKEIVEMEWKNSAED